MSSQSPRVIYVTGVGRSGSTVLDTLLGNHHKVESVGELVNAPAAWINNNEYCACGDLAGVCDFWKQVRDQWQADPRASVDCEKWPRIQAHFERVRNWPRLIRHAQVNTEAFIKYAEGIVGLYRSIAEVSGKSIIVDSSKTPGRALALSQIQGIDLSLLHLVRDGRGVAWSLQKSYAKDPARGIQRPLKGRTVSRSAFAWRVINTLTERAMARVPRDKRLTLRYEDLVTEPDEALHRIGQTVGVDMSGLSEAIKEGSEFSVGHTIAGNRIRMGGRLQLKADRAWEDQMPVRDRRIFWFVAGGKARKLGYPKNP